MNNCSCIPVDTNFDTSCIENKIKKANTEYVCCECGGTIQIGERYEYYHGKCEGDTFSCNTCLDCLSIRKAFFYEGHEYEGMFIYLEEHINEKCGEISSDCITPLTKRAKDMVCDMIEESWGDDDE